MRSILEYKVTSSLASVDTEKETFRSLAESGWTSPDLGVSRDDLVDLAWDVIKRTQKAGRDLPTSPESAYIQAAIDTHFPISSERSSKSEKTTTSTAAIDPTTEARFRRNTFERFCLEQAHRNKQARCMRQDCDAMI